MTLTFCTVSRFEFSSFLDRIAAALIPRHVGAKRIAPRFIYILWTLHFTFIIPCPIWKKTLKLTSPLCHYLYDIPALQHYNLTLPCTLRLGNRWTFWKTFHECSRVHLPSLVDQSQTPTTSQDPLFTSNVCNLPLCYYNCKNAHVWVILQCYRHGIVQKLHPHEGGGMRAVVMRS